MHSLTVSLIEFDCNTQNDTKETGLKTVSTHLMIKQSINANPLINTVWSYKYLYQ